MPLIDERRMKKSRPLGKRLCKFQEPCTLGLVLVVQSSKVMDSKMVSRRTMVPWMQPFMGGMVLVQESRTD